MPSPRKALATVGSIVRSYVCSPSKNDDLKIMISRRRPRKENEDPQIPNVDSPEYKRRRGELQNLAIDMVEDCKSPSTSKRVRKATQLYQMPEPVVFSPLKEKTLKNVEAKKSSKMAPSKRCGDKKDDISFDETLSDISSDDDSDVYKSEEDDVENDDDYDSGDDFEDSSKFKKRNRRVATVKKIASSRKTMPKPRMPKRSIKLPDNVECPLEEAQLRLHVAAVPDSLPCREDEFAEIYSFVEGKVRDGTSGCMYVSGLPGTGKTATVKEVIRTLSEDDSLDFECVEINGMRLTEPNQAYVQIWSMLSNGEKVTAEHARNLIDKRFTQKMRKKATVLIVDELDMLWNRKQSVLYNLFEWPANKTANLTVLAIANTMDLPERIMINRVSSRMGLTRITFSPYTHEQLSEIVAARLAGLEDAFNGDAVKLVARKVSSLSGDARRALDICRRAAEIAQRDKVQGVGMAQVTAAHSEMFSTSKMAAVRNCSPWQKMMLQAVSAVFIKTGIEEATFGRVHEVLKELSALDGFKAMSVTQAHALLNSLAAMRLVLAEPNRSGRLDLKIRLNISLDDVSFALRK